MFLFSSDQVEDSTDWFVITSQYLRCKHMRSFIIKILHVMFKSQLKKRSIVQLHQGKYGLSDCVNSEGLKHIQINRKTQQQH